MIRILNTRPQEYANKFTLDLQKNDFEVLSFPFITFEFIEDKFKDKNPLSYQGLFFSSLTGWNAFISNPLFKKFKNISVYSLSELVAENCNKMGFKLGYVSKKKSWKGFLKEYSTLENSQNWLHFCSEKTNISIHDFQKKNIKLENSPLYRPVIHLTGFQNLAQNYEQFDWVLLTAGSIVEAFWECVFQLSNKQQQRFFEDVTYCCLGDSAHDTLLRILSSRLTLKQQQHIKIIYSSKIDWNDFLKLLREKGK